LGLLSDTVDDVMNMPMQATYRRRSTEKRRT
jgi:hypothetical protein